MGSSTAGACSTFVSASRSRPFATNFGLCNRTTTSEAGRRSTVSTTSSPMRSKASSPAFWTSSGRISTSTRGSVSGKGLRPVGFARAWARTSEDGGGCSDAAAAEPVSIPTIDSVSWSAPTYRSRFCPVMPRSSFLHSSSIET